MYADKLYSLCDEALLEYYYQTRNYKAFQLLYQRYKNPLFRYCIQISQARGCQLLEDLWNEILETPPKLAGRRLSNWFYIQINRRVRNGNLDTPVVTDGDEGAASHEREKIQQTLQHPLLNAVQQLPRQERNILLLHRECELSLATVADIERLSLQRCREKLHSALQALEITLHGSAHKPWKIAVQEESTPVPQPQLESARIGIWQRITEKVQGWLASSRAGRRHHSASGVEKIA